MLGASEAGRSRQPPRRRRKPTPLVTRAPATYHIHPVLARYDKIIGDRRPDLTALEESRSSSLFSLLHFLTVFVGESIRNLVETLSELPDASKQGKQ